MGGENAKRKIVFDMTMKEAEYWLARLQDSLRVIGVTNVKYLALESKNCDYGARKNEASYIPVRPMNFEGRDYFDKTKVDHLYVYGYLPMKKKRATFCYRGGKDEGTIKYQIFMDYIGEFLRDCFELYADVHIAETISSERWKIPVKPISRSE